MKKLDKLSLTKIEKESGAFKGLEAAMCSMLASIELLKHKTYYGWNVNAERDECTAELWGDCYLILNEIVKE